MTQRTPPEQAPPEQPSQELKTAGLKVTQPRLRVLSVLESDPSRHWSAEDVYRALTSLDAEIGLATVYRVLTQFESAGLVVRRRFSEGHALYELDRGPHHDHIVCVDCGHIEEFVDETIEKRQREIATRHGFSICDHSLVLYGVCSRKKCPHRAA
jgi:Fur family transcriptional regulator, ferric uptake regulator